MLSATERATEALLMGLRLAEGVDTAPLSAILDEAAIARLVTHGLLAREGTRIALTAAGRLLLDAVLREITV